MCADALEQLGYQAESGIWRNAYLTAAKELREGVTKSGNTSTNTSGDMLRALQPTMVLDMLGIRIDSNKAQGLNFAFNLNVVEVLDGEVQIHHYLATIRSGVLLYQVGASNPNADVTIRVPLQAVALLLAKEGLNSEYVQITGKRELLDEMYKHLAEFNPNFNIVEPKV